MVNSIIFMYSSNTLHLVHDETELISTDDVAGSETSSESQYVAKKTRRESQNVAKYRFRINKGKLNNKKYSLLLKRSPLDALRNFGVMTYLYFVWM